MQEQSKKRVPWNKGKKGLQVAWNKGKKGPPPWNKGLKLSDEYRQRLSEAHRKTAEEVFWSHAIPAPGCWGWDGKPRADGYAVFFADKKAYYAHRFSWMFHRGSIDQGLQVDHLCRNRSCTNPKHLRLATIKQNVLAGIGRSAENTRKTHCPKGHPYTGDNLFYGSKGDRRCRECNRQQCAEYGQRRRTKAV